jgi:hypothetical protein
VNFVSFFETWAPQHEEFVAQAREAIDPEWVPSLRDYAGRELGTFRVCLAPLSSGNYGIPIDFPTGVVNHMVVAPSHDGRPHFSNRKLMKYMMLHEGAHCFVNPALQTCADAMSTSVALMEPIADHMRGGASQDCGAEC